MSIPVLWRHLCDDWSEEGGLSFGDPDLLIERIRARVPLQILRIAKGTCADVKAGSTMAQRLGGLCNPDSGHRVFQLADAIHFANYPVSRFEPDRGGTSHAYTWRRTRKEEVARIQREHMGEVSDELLNSEKQLICA